MGKPPAMICHHKVCHYIFVIKVIQLCTNLPRGQKVQVCSPIPTPVTVHPLQSKSFRWRSDLLFRIVRFTLVLGTDKVDDLVVEVDREQTVIP